jgi:hypothetical protein
MQAVEMVLEMTEDLQIQPQQEQQPKPMVQLIAVLAQVVVIIKLVAQVS